MRGPQRNELLELLSQFKQGRVNGVPVRMERLQTLISSACLEHLDFLDEDLDLDFITLKELEIDNSQYKSLSDLPKLTPSRGTDESNSKPEDFLKLTLNELICLLRSTGSSMTKALILNELINRYGMTLQIQDVTIEVSRTETIILDYIFFLKQISCLSQVREFPVLVTSQNLEMLRS